MWDLEPQAQLERALSRLAELPPQRRLPCLGALFSYLVNASPLQAEQVVQSVRRTLSEQEARAVVTIRQRALEEGRVLGRGEGRVEALREVASRLAGRLLGPLPTQTQQAIATANAAQLEALVDQLPDLQTSSDIHDVLK